MEFALDEITHARDTSIASLLGLPEGRRQTIRCPFHNEHTPSCVLYPDNGYHCFGCGKNGHGAISFVMEMGYSFHEAVNYIRQHNGLDNK